MKVSKWWIVTLVVLVGCFAAAFFLDRLFAGELDGVLVVDNTYDVPVEVFLDGESAFMLDPGQSIAHELRAGSTYEIEVRGLDEVLDQNSFELTEPAFNGTSKAVYVLGPGRGYALVTVRYFVNRPTNPPDPVIEPVTIRPGELYPLSEEVIAAGVGVDLEFPVLGVVSDGETFTDRTHLCHYSQADESVGCQ